MPIEAIALTMQEPPFVKCPKCGAEPFTPFMRGEVQRSWFKSWTGWKAVMFGWPFDYCAVICADCKKIVGWERPHDLAWLMEKYERHSRARRMVREHQEARAETVRSVQKALSEYRRMYIKALREEKEKWKE